VKKVSNSELEMLEKQWNSEKNRGSSLKYFWQKGELVINFNPRTLNVAEMGLLKMN
jgi:hypothetical protein